MRFWVLIIIFTYNFNKSFSKLCNDSEIISLCINTKSSCMECLNVHFCCKWCYDKEFTGPRCRIKQDLIECKIYDKDSELEIKEERQFSILERSYNDVPATQIQPQKIKARLKPGDSVTFQVKYKAIENYPLDLYFLMDLSYSMRSYLQTISQLGEILPSFLNNLTTTFQLALGYYSDKVTLPYYATDFMALQNPCFNSEIEYCRPGFDFHHILNFTNHVKTFINKVNSSETTANLDDLEGGFDALMQVLVCDQMQWRKYSRKMVVIATDGDMHTAGDGLLGGVVKKNPGICHLDHKGEYTKSLDYDYPSLGEIYRKLLEKKINVLFLVRNKDKFYKEVNTYIPDVTHFATLSEGEQILNLIKETYHNVVRYIKLIPNLQGNSVLEISSKSHCNKYELYNHWNSTFSCNNVKTGEEYVFNITIKMKNKPKDNGKGELVVIQELNLHENVTVSIEFIEQSCTCDSDEDVTGECQRDNAECGVCNCVEGWVGTPCEKVCKNVCRFKNDTITSIACFGRGICNKEKCTCDCNPGYRGVYCEEKECPRKNGRLCNGHGICNYGICDCDYPYSGDDCSCKDSNSTCMIGDKLCNNMGDCVCGECRCKKINGIQYAGRYCEWCPECNEFCQLYADCLLAIIKGNPDDCSEDESTLFITSKGTITEDHLVCYERFDTDSEICNLKFTYDNRYSIVKLKYEIDCFKVSTAQIVCISVVVLILAVGILMIIIYKISIMIHDRRECAEFKKGRFSVKYDKENPLYSPPITTYTVPELARQFTFPDLKQMTDNFEKTDDRGEIL